jgi:hypothetical protein
VLTMEIYNNELYVGGHIENINGSPAEHVMKWNGNQWSSVGFGSDNNASASTVTKLVVHDNKLFAFGYYQNVAFMPCYSASVFDGTKWCAFQDSINSSIYSIVNGATVFRDSICLIGRFDIPGSPNIKQVARLRDENLYKNCNGVGINEPNNIEKIIIFPNPTSSTIYISAEHEFETGTEIEFVNALGQVVLKQSFTNEIDIKVLSSGFYTIRITGPLNQKYHSKLIKE